MYVRTEHNLIVRVRQIKYDPKQCTLVLQGYYVDRHGTYLKARFDGSTIGAVFTLYETSAPKAKLIRFKDNEFGLDGHVQIDWGGWLDSEKVHEGQGIESYSNACIVAAKQGYIPIGLSQEEEIQEWMLKCDLIGQVLARS